MALDRLLPVSTTPGAITGDSYMDAVQEEVTGLWDRSVITLTAVAGTNTITATAAPALTGALAGNMNFILKPAATNTSTVTLNVNGGGAVAVVDAEGTALVAGALRINANYLLHYDSTFAKYVIVSYTPSATLSPGLKLLATATPLATPSTIDFFNGAAPTSAAGTITASGTVVLDNTYDAYHLVCSNVHAATDDVEAWLRVGTGGTPTYQVTNYGYASLGQRTDNTAFNISSTTSTGGTKIVLGTSSTAAIAVGNAAPERFDCTIDFADPEDTVSYASFQFRGSYNTTAGELIGFGGAGEYHVAGAITAVRFQFESGNITSGRFSLYGRTKA